MKTKLLILLALLLPITLFFSQNTGITYQALIINPEGEKVPGFNNLDAPLANQQICMRFSIYDSNGVAEYVENVKTKTDKAGIVNLIIGTGQRVAGYARDFSAIHWDNTLKRLQVEFDATATCTNYLEVSNQAFSYVPFSYYSDKTKEASNIAPGSIQLSGDLAGIGSTAMNPKISENAINTSKIADSSVTTGKILDGTIVNADVSSEASIAYSKLNLANSVVTSDLVDSSVTTSKIEDSSVTTGKILDGTIVNADVSSEASIAYSKLNLANSVVTSDLVDSSVTTSKIADSSVTTGKILDGTIVNADVSSEASIAYSKLNLANSVVTSDLVDSSVTTSKIADSSVTTGKILDGTIVNADVSSEASIAYSKLNLANSVVTSDLVDSSVTTSKIEDSSVTTGKILDGSVTNAKIASGISPSKVGLENVNNTSDANKPVSTAQQAALDLKENLSNKSTNILTDSSSDVKYPSVKSVKTYVDNTVASVLNYGDIKTGIQANDHKGWVKLDGRLKSSLTASQQAQATALGIGANLPDATNAYLSQNGGSLGGVAGSNSKTITQSNLPNISFYGNAAAAGDHAHSVDPPNTNTASSGVHSHSFSDNYFAENRGWGNNLYGTSASTDSDNDLYSVNNNTSNAGAHTHSVDIAAFNSSTTGNHTHAVAVSSGGSGTALDITPKTLSVNTFIYLGN